MRAAAFLEDDDILQDSDLVRDLQATPYLGDAAALAALLIGWQPARLVLTAWVGKPLSAYRAAADGRWPVEVIRMLPDDGETGRRAGLRTQ